MVRVEVCEEDALNVACIETHFVDVSRTGVACIKNKKLLSSNDQGTRPAPFVIRHGGACAANSNVQTIG